MGVFDDIFVISLKARTDRRARMNKLGSVLQLDWTYLDASEASDPGIAHIAENVRAVRAGHTYLDFHWPSLDIVRNGSTEDFPLAGAELWTLDPSDPRALHALPPAPVPDTRPPLESMIQNFRLKEPGQGLPLIPARFANWRSHMAAVRRIADARDPAYVALILEDDVDLEWDVAARVARTWDAGALPADWDMVYLGHCPSFSDDPRTTEAQHPALRGAPQLRPSRMPICAHGYALSRDGARRLLSQLRYDLFGYSRPVDAAYADLIAAHRVKSFTFMPPIVIQVRDGKSDIWGVDMTNIAIKGDLSDSTLQRIALLEKQERER